MIVRPSGNVLHLITQPDHAALAGRIMQHWASLQGADRRASILRAIEEHDNGWREVDEAPTVDPASGRVYDFVNIPADVRRSVWPRGVARLSHDPWAAALVAQHALTVYSRFRSDPSWDAFFATLQCTRDELVAQTTLAISELEADYAFVRLGDLISLIFCNQWQEETFACWRVRREGDSVVVSPDAFAGAEIPVSIGAREIPNRPYTSADDLRDALRESRSVMLTGTVR